MTDLLIIPLKLLQDVLTRIGIVNEGIPLRAVNELEVPRSRLAENRFWWHFSPVAERDDVCTDLDSAMMTVMSINFAPLSKLH